MLDVFEKIDELVFECRGGVFGEDFVSVGVL